MKRNSNGVKKIGIPDEFGETASLEWQLTHFGMTAKDIIKATQQILKA